MSTGQTIGVTGATGFVGRAVVAELLARGFGVRALARDADKARRVLPGSVERVIGDALDAERLGELLEGCAACIHLVGIIRQGGGGRTFRRVHVGATRAVIDACRRAGVARLLHVSALGASPEGVCEYQRTKYEGEELVRRSGLEWTIFRPGLIHGPGADWIRMAKGWVTGQSAPYLFLPYFARETIDASVAFGAIRHADPVVQPIAVADAARAIVAAIDRPESVGEVYNLVGAERLTWPEMLREVRDRIPGGNDDLEPWGIPAPRAARLARAASALGLGGALPFDAGMALMGAQDMTASADKARADLGLDPAPFRASFASYAGAL